MKTAKKYRVNGSELFNLDSMHTHLQCMLYDIRDGVIEGDEEEIINRIEEVENLLSQTCGVGSLVPWETLKRIREIKEERQVIRYATCLNAGMSESEAAYAFDD